MDLRIRGRYPHQGGLTGAADFWHSFCFKLGRHKPEIGMANALDSYLAPLQRAMDLHAYRQQLLAANIANADTPNYHAVDLNFAKAYKAAMEGAAGNLTLRRNDPRQLPATGGATGLAAYVAYQAGNPVGLNGNSVNMDREQSAFLKNSVHYEADLTFLTGKIKTMLSAITGS